jgi:hypothetical protein
MSIARTPLLTPARPAVQETRSASNASTRIMEPVRVDLKQPGPEHHRLAGLVGTWNVVCTIWTKPDAPATQSTALATFTTILDGRYIQEDFKGSMLGHAFAGCSILGYDRVAKRYVSTWCDTMGTGITHLTGTSSSDDGKSLISTGDVSCAEDGKPAKLRQVETHQSDDQFTRQLYQLKDGTERMTLELTYSRRK